MTCSTTSQELLERPVRMKCIEHAVLCSRSVEDCWWPEGSPEWHYWMDLWAEKEKPPAATPGASIPHQRDVRSRQLRAINEQGDSIWPV